MNNATQSVLFLGKKGDIHTKKALEFCRRYFRVTGYLGEWGDPFPKDIEWWDGDYVISYLSRWIVPEYLLERAKISAFNFHPATPNYPGIGCVNFALYEEASEYGVTCHHMAPKVDTGQIILVKRFPVHNNDNVSTLLSRTYDYQLLAFYEVMDTLIKGEKLPLSEETWTRRPFTRREFEKLGKITLDMSKEEIARRARSITFDKWRPTLLLNDFEFELKEKHGHFDSD